MTPRIIPQSALENCVVFSNRTEMLGALKMRGCVAEVGTREGKFARAILDRTHAQTLHLIDRDWTKFEFDRFRDELRLGRVQIHDGDAVELLRKFEDRKFDWIYLDAARGETNVRHHTAAAIEKVKRDGCLVFCGYIGLTRRGDQYGVLPVVNDMLCGGGWKMVAIGLQKGGYHDVALKRCHCS